MLCQHCYKKNATIIIAHVENEVQKELYLCESCAEKEGLNQTISNLPQIFTGLMMEILKYKEKQGGLPARHVESGLCPACGYSWDDFKRNGLFGCDQCYLTFKQQIKGVLKRLHGHTRHVGKRPGVHSNFTVEQNLQFLERALWDAVKKEEYEKAAVFRDKIRSLKKGKQ